MGAEPTSIPFFWRDLTHQTLSALQSPGPLPLFSAPSHLSSVRVRVVTPSLIILRCEAVVVKRKDFRVFFFSSSSLLLLVCFLFFQISRDFCLFSPRELWWVMFSPLTFRVKRFVIYWLSWKGMLACGCWVIHPSPCFKLFSLDYLEWSKVVFGWFRPKVDKTKTTMFLKV